MTEHYAYRNRHSYDNEPCIKEICFNLIILKIFSKLNQRYSSRYISLTSTQFSKHIENFVILAY